MTREGALIVSVLCCALLPSAAAVASGARPWEVGLRHSRLGHRFCGGSIVNDRFVVTAASCLAGDGGGGGATALGPEDLRVRPGDHIGLQRTAVPGLDPGRGRRRRQGRLTHGADYKVEEIFVHPDFDPETLRSDIAVLRTERMVLERDRAWPVCLPDDDPPVTYEERYASQSGWGYLSLLSGPNPSLLPANNLAILSNEECADDVGDGSAATRMCAKSGFFHFDTCTADRGGGVTLRVFNVDVQDVLIGVVSPKGDSPGCPTAGTAGQASYSLVGPHYHRWLLDVTRGTTHCVPHRIFKDHHRRRLVAANRLGGEE